MTVTTQLSDAELTVRIRQLVSGAGSFKRWGKYREEAEAQAEARRLVAVRARLRADRALAAAGARYEDYLAVVADDVDDENVSASVSASASVGGDDDVTGDG